MDNEVWLPVVGYEGLYSVSNLGRVRSEARTVIRTDGRIQDVPEKMMILFPSNCEYLRVGLNKDNRQKSHLVHRLVAKAFIDNPEELPQVNHLNRVRTDNRLENLEWTTAKENIKHRDIENDYNIGENSHLSKLKAIDVELIREMWSTWKMTQTEIAKLFSTSQANISEICLRKSWSHI